MSPRIWPLCAVTFSVAASLAWPVAPAHAIGPANVWIVVNKNVPASRTLADYYCARRGVPRDHILTFDLPTTEDVSRPTFEQRLLQPLRVMLKDKKDVAKVLLTTYGVPLRVGPDAPTPAEAAELVKVKAQLQSLYTQRSNLDAQIKTLEPLARADPKGKAAQDLAVAKQNRANVAASIAALEARQRWLNHQEAVAALDSDLAMLWGPPPSLRQWFPNSLYFRIPEASRRISPPVVMTCRLDGPTVDIAKGLVDKAILAESRGLAGKVYVDAQGKKFDKTRDPSGNSYEAYDESLREFGRQFAKGGMMVTLDDKTTLFPPGGCPGTALYCGWYSHAKYIDSFTFVPGAVGYHMASSEAVSLRNPKATFWCKCMLERGITATLGPVGEPYTIGFPKPAEFFNILGTGQYTLVESYWQSQRNGSWMIVLVGDPLYKPFARAPKVKVTDIVPSPIGTK